MYLAVSVEARFRCRSDACLFSTSKVSKLHLHHPGMSNVTSSEGVLSRAQNFVSENKKVIIAGVAVVAVVGVAAAAYYSTSPNAGVPRVPRDDLELGKSPSGRKKGRKPRKGPPPTGPGSTTSKLDDANGPIIEERAQTDTPDSVLHHTCFHPLLLISLRVAPVQLNEADIEKLSPEVRILPLAT